MVNPYIEKYWDTLIEYFDLKTEESHTWERSIIQIANNRKNPAYKIAKNLIKIDPEEEKNNPFSLDYTKDFWIENATDIFNKGFDKAKKYAQETFWVTIHFEGTWTKTKSINSSNTLVNPIELQRIFDSKGNEIWNILPEKEHLVSFKDSEEIFSEIKTLLDKKYKKKESWWEGNNKLAA